MLTDDQVRAELERIDPEYAKTWNALMEWIKINPNDKYLPEEVKVLRLLAESQQALGEIIAECPKPKSGYGKRIVEIARNAVKGGSNG